MWDDFLRPSIFCFFWGWWGRTTSFWWTNLGEFLRPKNQDGSDVLQGASLNSFGEFFAWQILWWCKFVCDNLYIICTVYIYNTLLAWVFWKSFAKFVVLDMAKSADKGCGISGKLPSNFVETFMSIRPWRKTALNAGTSRRDAHVGLLFWGSTASGVLCLYCCKCVLWPLLEEETSFQWYQIQELFHGGFFGLAQHERLREILWRFVWRSSFWVKHVDRKSVV